MEDSIYTLIFLFISISIIYIVFRGKLYNYHSHWNHLIDNFSFSSQEFYTLVSKELRKNGIKDVRFEKVKLRKGNIFSSRRLYQRIHWKEYHFDICAAPFGNGFFLSWWLIYNRTFIEILIIYIPFLGPWIHSKLFTATYYKIDTASMFMTYAQQSVINVVDELTSSEGLRILTEEERKPILKDIFSR